MQPIIGLSPAMLAPPASAAEITLRSANLPPLPAELPPLAPLRPARTQQVERTQPHACKPHNKPAAKPASVSSTHRAVFASQQGSQDTCTYSIFLVTLRTWLECGEHPICIPGNNHNMLTDMGCTVCSSPYPMAYVLSCWRTMRCPPSRGSC